MILKVVNLYKSYDKESSILKGVSLELDGGQTALLMGRSGSGKSTFLNCICGIEHQNSGDIYIDEKLIDIDDKNHINKVRKKDIGIIFQQYYLLSHTTVYNQISLICDAKKDEIYDILKELDIYNLKDKMIEDCSGGQQQRVCIARALAKKPKLILADEPTANLDFSLAIVSIKLMIKLTKRFNSGLLIVTHDDRIIEYADKIFELENGKISLKDKR